MLRDTGRNSAAGDIVEGLDYQRHRSHHHPGLISTPLLSWNPVKLKMRAWWRLGCDQAHALEVGEHVTQARCHRCGNALRDGVIVDVDIAARRRGWCAWFAIGAVFVITSAGCTSHADVVHLPAAASPRVSGSAHCDGATANDVYQQFATAFNADEVALAAAQFAGQHPGFTWWDPSDPSGHTQARTELADHFQHMRRLGVRLPTTATFTAADDNEMGGFTFNEPRDGFYGKGGLDCGTGKLSYLVIDGWTKNIAGHAPLTTG